MNIEVRDSPTRSEASGALAIADCDIHHSPKTFKLIYPYLETRWQRHIDAFGTIARQRF